MTPLELMEHLKNVSGCKNIYFQPPASLEIHYPCIQCKIETPTVVDANNSKYSVMDSYSITYITRDVYDDVPRKILMNTKYCREDRRFTASNMYHTVLTINGG